MTTTSSADAITTISAHARTVRGSNAPVVFSRDGKIFANSEDVATFFGKQHFNVLRDIRTLISHDKSLELKFEFTSRSVKSGNGASREVATCNMDRDGFTVLTMGFSGKRALQWKLAYLAAFNEMEARLSDPANSTELSNSQIDAYELEIHNLNVTVSYLEGIIDRYEANCLEDLIFRHRKNLNDLNYAKNRAHTYDTKPEPFDDEDRSALMLLAYVPKSQAEARTKVEYLKTVPHLDCLYEDQVTALLASIAATPVRLSIAA